MDEPERTTQEECRDRSELDARVNAPGRSNSKTDDEGALSGSGVGADVGDLVYEKDRGDPQCDRNRDCETSAV